MQDETKGVHGREKKRGENSKGRVDQAQDKRKSRLQKRRMKRVRRLCTSKTKRERGGEIVTSAKKKKGGR